MAAPNVTAVVLTCAVVQGAAIVKARQAGTWPAPRTELGIVSVGLILLVATRLAPEAKWFGIVIALGALAGVGTKAPGATSSAPQTNREISNT